MNSSFVAWPMYVDGCGVMFAVTTRNFGVTISQPPANSMSGDRLVLVVFRWCGTRCTRDGDQVLAVREVLLGSGAATGPSIGFGMNFSMKFSGTFSAFSGFS
jgi:hypothetical protein